LHQRAVESLFFHFLFFLFFSFQNDIPCISSENNQIHPPSPPLINAIIIIIITTTSPVPLSPPTAILSNGDASPGSGQFYPLYAATYSQLKLPPLQAFKSFTLPLRTETYHRCCCCYKLLQLLIITCFLLQLGSCDLGERGSCLLAQQNKKKGNIAEGREVPTAPRQADTDRDTDARTRIHAHALARTHYTTSGKGKEENHERGQ
jgi:hypothetical protein